MFRFLILIIFIFSSQLCIAQNNATHISISLKSIDYLNTEVCYYINLNNASPENFILAGQNLRIFYDSGIYELNTEKLVSLLPQPKYTPVNLVQSVEHLDAMGTGSFSFDADLGFLNFFIDLNEVIQGGVLVENDAVDFPFVEMCFNMIADTENLVCPSIILAREDTSTDYANAFIEISQWLDPSLQTSLDIVSYGDVDPMEEINCIDFLENTIDECIDQIDNDGDGLVDCLDISCNDIGIICETDILTCSDGIDNDGDGDIDCDDASCSRPIIQDVVASDVTDCDNLNNGIIEITASGMNLTYSIDGGVTYTGSGIVEDLIAGEYNIYVRNEMTGCIAEYGTLVVVTEDCTVDTEVDCTDGIDNDLNGFIDCDDLYCFDVSAIVIQVDSSCLIEPTGSITVTNLNPSYIISINDGEIISNGDDLFDLPAGNYKLEILSSIFNCVYTWPDGIDIPLKDCNEIEQLVEICNDGLDNDLDGLIDCADSDCFDVVDCTRSVLYVPNVFSPFNYDGVNDDLVIGINLIYVERINQVQIFDRWGNKVHDIKPEIASRELVIWRNDEVTDLVGGVYSVRIVYTNNLLVRLTKVFNVTII